MSSTVLYSPVLYNGRSSELFMSSPLAPRPPTTPSISIPVTQTQLNPLRYSLTSSTSSVSSSPPDSPVMLSPCQSPSPPRAHSTDPSSGEHKKRKRGRPPLEKDSRQCANCGTTTTPEWRKGPHGPHTLCNACGLQYMKSQRKENQARAKGSLGRVLNSSDGSLNSSNGSLTNSNGVPTSPGSPSQAASPSPVMSSADNSLVIAKHRANDSPAPVESPKKPAMNMIPLAGGFFNPSQLIPGVPNTIIGISDNILIANPIASTPSFSDIPHSYPPLQLSRMNLSATPTNGFMPATNTFVQTSPLLNNTMQLSPSLQSPMQQGPKMQFGGAFQPTNRSVSQLSGVVAPPTAFSFPCVSNAGLAPGVGYSPSTSALQPSTSNASTGLVRSASSPVQSSTGLHTPSATVPTSTDNIFLQLPNGSMHQPPPFTRSVSSSGVLTMHEFVQAGGQANLELYNNINNNPFAQNYQYSPTMMNLQQLQQLQLEQIHQQFSLAPTGNGHM